MDISRNPGEISLTARAVEKKAEKLQRLYMKRMKKHEGRRPEKEIFIFTAAYLLFKEKYPDRKTIFSRNLPPEWNLLDWLDKNFSQYCIYDWKKLYKWMGGRPFKEMQWEKAWDDLRAAQKISDRGADKGEMNQRDIMRAYTISKQEFEVLIPWVLSHHAGNKKASDKFIFNRPDK